MPSSVSNVEQYSILRLFFFKVHSNIIKENTGRISLLAEFSWCGHFQQCFLFHQLSANVPCISFQSSLLLRVTTSKTKDWPKLIIGSNVRTVKLCALPSALPRFQFCVINCALLSGVLSEMLGLHWNARTWRTFPLTTGNTACGKCVSTQKLSHFVPELSFKKMLCQFVA